jgi:Flp pilus assembly pilin Flp
MQNFFRRLWYDEAGQDLIEYALLAALVATGSAILIPTAVNDSMSHIYSRVNSCLVRFGNGGG